MTIADSSCPYGLACRVTAIANGLSRHERILFRWIENAHCPAPLESVFPHGIPGVEFQKTTEDFETVFFDHRQANCWWNSAGDRHKANAAYIQIMSAMTGRAYSHPPAVAILGRFHTNPTASPDMLADAAITQADNLGAPRVFLLSDKFRFEIALRLSHAGITPVLPLCPPLPIDLDRSLPDLLAYASDWKTMLAAKAIVAIDGPASALHPARAFGIPIHRIPAGF